jgi:hypothetical protein
VDPAIGLLESPLMVAGLDTLDFPESVYELFEEYCVESNDLPGFLVALEELQIEFHDYIFHPRNTLQIWLP